MSDPRSDYMDNQKSAQLTEAFTREKKIQRDYFRTQEEAGLIHPKPPTPKKETKTLLDTLGVPDHINTLHSDPIQAMNTSISKQMWTSNPGYLIRDGPHMASRFKKDFTYDEEELEYMKSLGFLDKKHNRRRDEFVHYVEASARMNILMKGGQAPK